MLRKRIILAFVFLTMLCELSLAQTKSFWYSGQFEQFRKKIDLPNVMYDYELESVYPDSSKTKLVGNLFKKGNIVLDENKEYTMLKTEHSYYRADHINKTIMIVDIDKIKSQSKNKKAFAENTNFETYLLPDSIIMQYGKVTIKTIRNIITIQIDYSQELTMRKSVIEYNTKKELIEQFLVVTDVLYESNPETGEDKFSQTTVKGFNFSTIFDENKTNQEQFFIQKNDKIILKKYQNYKLTILN